MLYEAFLSATVFRNVGRREAPRKIIEESKSVYPIIAVLIMAAVEKRKNRSIHGLGKGSAGPVSRTPALPHSEKEYALILGIRTFTQCGPRDATLLSAGVEVR
jgi:hypothetical protein